MAQGAIGLDATVAAVDRMVCFDLSLLINVGALLLLLPLCGAAMLISGLLLSVRGHTERARKIRMLPSRGPGQNREATFSQPPLSNSALSTKA